MSEELKPCPFCGGECAVVRAWAAPKYYSVTCLAENCMGVNMEQDEQGGFSAEFPSKAKAIAAWNRRVAEC